MSFAAVTVPNVKDLHPACDGEGLLLTGWASTWDLDRAGDRVNPFALDKAVEQYMSTNPVLLWSHKYALPPIGRVLKARIDRSRGLWIEAVMPRPRDGTFAAEVWQAAKAGIVKAFSLGAAWLRSHAKGYQEIIGCDLREISLCSIGVNGLTLADAITPTTAKCIDGLWLRDDFSSRWDAAVAAHRVRDLQRDVGLAELELEVAALLLA
jgi:HK97 family phage prohead protease